MGDSSTNATTRGRSRARLIALLATAGVLEGIVVALFAFRRFGGRQPRSTWIEFDTLRVSAQRDDAWRGARALRLDPNERTVLLTMVRKPGHIFSREDIAALAWPERTDVSPRLVSTMMDHLQRTVDGFDDTPLVHAVRGAGYVLSDPTDTDDSIASAIKPRLPRYAPPPNRPASRR
jgi:DNA-binding response OmpR family regulator